MWRTIFSKRKRQISVVAACYDIEMTSLSRATVVRAVIAGGVCAFFTAGLVRAIAEKGLGSSDAAGWIQAIGATVGLGIAIWVPYKQKTDSQHDEAERRRQDALRICTALHDELVLMGNGLSGKHFSEIIRNAPGEIFPVELPMSSNPHPIFDALVSRLVEIGDVDTRRGVITAYASSSTFRHLLGLNTKLLHHYSELKRASKRDARVEGTTPYARDEDFAMAQLIGLRAQLRDSAIKMKSNLELAITDLEEQISHYGQA